MNVKNFNLLGESLGYHKEGTKSLEKGFVSSYKGYPIALELGAAEFGANSNKLLSLRIYLPKPKTQEKHDLKELKKQLKIALAQTKPAIYLNNSYVTLVLKTSKKTDETVQINQSLEQVVTIFSEQGLEPIFQCPVCMQEDCDSMYFDNADVKKLVPTHAHCKDQLVETQSQQMQQEEADGNNILGIVGILVGGLVGTLANALLLYFLNIQVGYLYALIPLGAFFGMQFMKGNPGITQTVLIVIWSFLQIFVVFTLYGYLELTSLGYSVSFMDVFEIIFVEDPSIFMKDLVFAFIFVGVGLIPTIAGSLNTAKRKEKNLMKSVQSMYPYTSLPSNSQDNITEESQEVVQ